MGSAEQWLREAEAVDRLADLVSFAPDKRRMRAQAEALRARAAAEEARSFQPPSDKAD